jgi:K+-transporting ATPase KdpF subunit
MYAKMIYHGKIEETMKTKVAISLMSLLVVPIQADAELSNGPVSYLIGGIVAILILGYLIYTLLRPDKF